jgi:hypothetical protein
MLPRLKKVFQISDALVNLRPTSSWSMTGDTYSSINWADPDAECPGEEEIAAEIVRLQAEYDAEYYQIQRAQAYPSIGDQLDALFHAGVFPPEMAAQLQAVKDLYPKPNN